MYIIVRAVACLALVFISLPVLAGGVMLVPPQADGALDGKLAPQAEAAAPAPSSPSLPAAVELYARGEYPQAYELAIAVVAVEPKNVDAYALAARAAAGMGELETADRVVNRGLTEIPDSEVLVKVGLDVFNLSLSRRAEERKSPPPQYRQTDDRQFAECPEPIGSGADEILSSCAWQLVDYQSGRRDNYSRHLADCCLAATGDSLGYKLNGVEKTYPEIVVMLLDSYAMDKKEKQYWVDILPSMSEEQRIRLDDVLTTGKLKELRVR